MLLQHQISLNHQHQMSLLTVLSLKSKCLKGLCTPCCGKALTKGFTTNYTHIVFFYLHVLIIYNQYLRHYNKISEGYAFWSKCYAFAIILRFLLRICYNITLFIYARVTLFRVTHLEIKRLTSMNIPKYDYEFLIF